ncbi:hypothetical protein [Saccharopolyspora spinosa]|uniref:hypothetical protein n=1 Tax=Saccharopolyspora spinosa TaxID=60894 RepID=UPI00376F13D6
MDVIPLALPGSERLFPWLAAVLAHPAPQPADDTDPDSAQLSLRAQPVTAGSARRPCPRSCCGSSAGKKA